MRRLFKFTVASVIAGCLATSTWGQTGGVTPPPVGGAGAGTQGGAAVQPGTPEWIRRGAEFLVHLRRPDRLQ
jgi:hypothetical protein